MPTVRTPIRYQRNPSRGWKGEHGRKVKDQRSGFWTYEAFLVTDDYGVEVDTRRSTYDIAYGDDGGETER